MRSPSSLLHSVRWRMSALLDPAAFIAGESTIASARDRNVRRELVEEAGRLGLRERLSMISPAHSGEPLEDRLLLRRLRVDDSDDPYFELGDRRLYFLPRQYRDRIDRFLDGILLVLKEAYLMPLDFFGGRAHILPGDTVLDVGGNIGTSALLFSRLTGPHGRVITFEPIFAEVLERNLAHNGIDNVELVPAAVGERTGTSEFEVTDRGIDARMRGQGAARAPTTVVPVTTLDGWLDRSGVERVDFVKMDIEGAEELALLGAWRTRTELRPAWSIASCHTDPEGRAQHARLARLLRQDAYEVEERGTKRILAWPAGAPRRAGRSHQNPVAHNQGSSAVGP